MVKIRVLVAVSGVSFKVTLHLMVSKRIHLPEDPAFSTGGTTFSKTYFD
jgi:hypothetical protein